jgi:two-component sensor histidine kinase
MYQLKHLLDINLPFVSELLLADIKLFVRDQNQIFVHNYYHSKQDSTSLLSKTDTGETLQTHKDAFIQKAFQLGKPLVGQYGLVVNNRRIQEFAFPIIGADYGKFHQETVAVISIQRDLYLTSTVLGYHWDQLADILIRTLKLKLRNNEEFPPIAHGEGAVFLHGRHHKIFYPTPLAASLLSEIADRPQKLIGMKVPDIYHKYEHRSRGRQLSKSVYAIDELNLHRRALRLRFVKLVDNFEVIIVKDISEVKIKDTLLKEIHHRVKNNLQTVASLLRMQQRRVPEVKEHFAEAINRINSISLVHETLSHSENIENVDFGQLTNKILTNLISTFDIVDLHYEFYCPQKIYIQSDLATNLALVFNEILSNSLEHGGDQLNKIFISLEQDKDLLKLIIKDNGIGFPEEFDYQTQAGLGWEIVRTLAVESLNAEIKTAYQEGALVEIVIPLKQ